MTNIHIASSWILILKRALADEKRRNQRKNGKKKTEKKQKGTEKNFCFFSVPLHKFWRKLTLDLFP